MNPSDGIRPSPPVVATLGLAARRPFATLLVIASIALVGAGALLLLLNLKAPGILTGAVGAALQSPGEAPVLLKAGLLRYLGEGWNLPAWVLVIVSIKLSILTILAVFGGMFALTSLVERKVLARIQNRFGPNRAGPWGLFQPIADGIKMLTKEDIVPTGAERYLHLLAPVLMVVPALLVLAIIPYGPGMVPVELGVGILFFFALGATTEVAVFMAGWSSNNKYALLGAMRAIAQMISYEMPLLLAALAVVMLSGSLAPAAFVAAQSGYSLGFIPNWFVFTPWGAAGFILFYVAALAESNRSPFDLPEGESELVAGHMTEYSGFRYAVFFLAEYISLFAICGFAVTLYLGGYHPPLPFLGFIPGYVWFFIKLYSLVLLAIWIRGTMPRVRIDQLMAFAWKCMIPAGFCIMAGAAVWHYTGGGILGWLLSTPVVIAPYVVLARSFETRVEHPRRTYRYSEG